MSKAKILEATQKFGTMPVFLTSISAILGAVLFLRFGYATGELGFWGVIGIIVLGHTITIPTALAISELATNIRVEGGGEYFVISRSFGLKIGSTIGITLFLAQAISIAFYVITFTESFQVLFDWFNSYFGFELPRQVISIPTLLLLAYIILYKGTGSSLKLLYIVNLLIAVSLVMFFLGSPLEYSTESTTITNIDNFGFFNRENFFIVFAICFPAFTGMTAGVGLSGDLKDPGKSIPKGIMWATFVGLLIYILVVWKFSVSASQADLLSNQLIMSKIAIFGGIVIPIGLAACTSSSALGSMMVAPRTLQAIAKDNVFPLKKLNLFLAQGKGVANEPYNASLLSFGFALIFVFLGDINTVAEIISMFFLITYGILCLSSFLNHFGSPPSYRPRFKSRWYLSFAGFILSVWVMFQINSIYTILAYIFIILIYIFVEYNNKDKKGIVNIFKGAIFQINRQLQVYVQKNHSGLDDEEWRPAAVCVSQHSFEREKIIELMKWISYKHGFGTYFHFIEDYYSKETHIKSKDILHKLLQEQTSKSELYIDTIISPSYTSAIAQVIQTPSISGMENNMMVFEYKKNDNKELNRILENVNLVRAGEFDVCIFACSDVPVRPKKGIHVWIRRTDEKNTNFMILLGYIILSHPDWRKSYIKLFVASHEGESEKIKEDLSERITEGRLPITLANIEIVPLLEHQKLGDLIENHSKQAGLTIVGFREELLKHNPIDFFSEFNNVGDTLFVNASKAKNIN